ncbi:GAF domain-containing protein [Variovorax ginsengisoli]|uniref:PAS domain S-box-containing protein n=1 Tax=Variovorax ginsengisoli TaxID=363844 RepID=A0ABT9S8W4_9BURK|nr:GAF domain-containing protein [Variovorax ginsengisoli]MDP9900794.1 PAS domain S-box-containing protein [Variovorax ginsengisoli]
MQSAVLREDEHSSLLALHSLEVLDSEPEAEFDALVHAASVICDVPISLITLIDQDRQWFKANLGLSGVTETPRDAAFCAHAVLGDDFMEVPDAKLDMRFVDNPLVISSPHIRFYAGAPIKLHSGVRVGTLCVIDREPRSRLKENQVMALRSLASAAAAGLERRAAIRRARRELHQAERASMMLFRHAEAVIGVTPAGNIESWNLAAQAMLGYCADDVIGKPLQHIVPLECVAQEMLSFSALSTGRARCYESIRLSLAQSLVQVAVTFVPVIDSAGRLISATQFLRALNGHKS